MHRMSELPKKSSFGGLVSAISGSGLATRPSRKAYEELPDQPQDATARPGDAALPKRRSGGGGLASTISGGGLSTRPSRKAYDELTDAEQHLSKPSPSPSRLTSMREEAEVGQHLLSHDICNWTPISQ